MDYKGFEIIVKDGKKRILNETNRPFNWFPELETAFNNFNMKSMEFEIDNFDEDVDRRLFKITLTDNPLEDAEYERGVADGRMQILEENVIRAAQNILEINE